MIEGEYRVALKTYRPKTPGLRNKANLTFEELTSGKPEKKLTTGNAFKAGRGAGGRVSVRRKGGRHKRKYRLVDFKRDNQGAPGKVISIEYDPNRSANIALIHFVNGDKRYILAPRGLKVGRTVESGENAPVEIGNSLPLERIPLGMSVHNVELKLGKGGQLARAAGAEAVVVAKEGDYVTIKLPSGESRMVFKKCSATIGEVGNEDHMNVVYGKAGAARWKGIRPHVRGVVMNPHDHPHGGGEGKTSGGRHPVSPWGQPTKGYKTRKKKKYSDKFVVKKRKK